MILGEVIRDLLAQVPLGEDGKQEGSEDTGVDTNAEEAKLRYIEVCFVTTNPRVILRGARRTDDDGGEYKVETSLGVLLMQQPQRDWEAQSSNQHVRHKLQANPSKQCTLGESVHQLTP